MRIKKHGQQTGETPEKDQRVDRTEESKLDITHDDKENDDPIDKAASIRRKLKLADERLLEADAKRKNIQIVRAKRLQ